MSVWRFIVICSSFYFSATAVNAFDRIPSHFAPVARLELSNGGACTATMISDHCALSAGHCVTEQMVMHFLPPDSYPSGERRDAKLENQFRVDTERVEFENSGISEDWAVFWVYPHQLTGRSAGEQQGVVPLNQSLPRRGRDLIAYAHGIDERAPTKNRIQQLSTGQRSRSPFSPFPRALNHNLNLPSGASGALVLDPSSKVGVAIHSHYSEEMRIGYATRLSHQPLARAISRCLNRESSL